MERANEMAIDQTELTDEDLKQAAGGLTPHRWYYKQGTGSGDTKTNTVWFVTSHT